MVPSAAPGTGYECSSAKVREGVKPSANIYDLVGMRRRMKRSAASLEDDVGTETCPGYSHQALRQVSEEDRVIEFTHSRRHRDHRVSAIEPCERHPIVEVPSLLR
ncbi:MAG: hypothetical protein SangKO_029310 [Sandaracinaceae bacterium]